MDRIKRFVEIRLIALPDGLDMEHETEVIVDTQVQSILCSFIFIYLFIYFLMFIHS